MITEEYQLIMSRRYALMIATLVPPQPLSVYIAAGNESKPRDEMGLVEIWSRPSVIWVRRRWGRRHPDGR